MANWGRGRPGLSLHCAQYVNVVCLTAPERRTSRAEQVGNKMAAVIMLAQIGGQHFCFMITDRFCFYKDSCGQKKRMLNILRRGTLKIVLPDLDYPRSLPSTPYSVATPMQPIIPD